jgi:hypothetical protein
VLLDWRSGDHSHYNSGPWRLCRHDCTARCQDKWATPSSSPSSSSLNHASPGLTAATGGSPGPGPTPATGGSPGPGPTGATGSSPGGPMTPLPKATAATGRGQSSGHPTAIRPPPSRPTQSTATTEHCRDSANPKFTSRSHCSLSDQRQARHTNQLKLSQGSSSPCQRQEEVFARQVSFDSHASWAPWPPLQAGVDWRSWSHDWS